MFFNDDKSTAGSITRGVHKKLITSACLEVYIFGGAQGGVQKEA
jgi:hypothetical protein